jgi:hypothetical protein
MNDVIDLCERIEQNPIPEGNSQGSVSWKLWNGDKVKEINIAGIAQGDFKIFEQIDLLLNTQLKIIAPG